MPNLDRPTFRPPRSGIRNVPWEQYVVTVDALETRSACDLLPRFRTTSRSRSRATTGRPSPSSRRSRPVSRELVRLRRERLVGSGRPELTYAWDFGDGTTGTGATASHVYADEGAYVATVTVTDPKGLDATATTTVTVTNVAPVITSFSIPTTLTTLGSSVSMQMAATDVGVNDALSMTVNWGDAPAGSFLPTSIGTTPATSSQTHTYAAAGVYTVTLTVTDGDGGVATQTYTQPIVIVDKARWVNGSGWLNGPGGKTTFNSTVRYVSGASLPSGSTDYAVNNGSFTFTATGYDWLVISNGRAQYTGTGTVAGVTGTVRFLATELDGSPDAIRLKVWQGSRVLYDNAPGAEISSLATPISGGNIIIH